MEWIAMQLKLVSLICSEKLIIDGGLKKDRLAKLQSCLTPKSRWSRSLEIKPRTHIFNIIIKQNHHPFE